MGKLACNKGMARQTHVAQKGRARCKVISDGLFRLGRARPLLDLYGVRHRSSLGFGRGDGLWSGRNGFWRTIVVVVARVSRAGIRAGSRRAGLRRHCN